MDQIVVWAELDGIDENAARHVLSTALTDIPQGHLSTSVVYAEDRGNAHLFVLGVTTPASAFLVAERVDRAVKAARATPTHTAMFMAAQRVGSDEPTLDEAILTVRLPVPPGREHEWNLWYAATHMTGLLATVGPTIRSGTRYMPLGGTADYLVAYDFTSVNAMRDWVDGQGIGGKRSDYQERWGVRNRMRALIRVT